MKPDGVRFGVLLAWAIAGCVAGGCGVLSRATERARQVAHTASELRDAVLHPRYAATEEELRRQGIPTQLSDILRAPSPAPNHNAAPLYQKILNNPAFQANKDEAAALRVESGSATPATWAAARQFVARHSAEISIAEEAARRPECVFPRHDDGSEPADIKFPELVAMRDATHVITIKSAVMAADGRGTAAVQEQSLGFTVSGHAAEDDGLLIPYLVAVASDAITLRGLQVIMKETHGDPAVAAAVEEAVNKDCARHSIVDAIKNETAFGNAEIEYDWRKLGGAPNSPRSGKSNALPPNAFMDLTGTTYLTTMQRSIAAIGLPYPQSKLQLDAIRHGLTGDIKYTYPALLDPATGELAVKAAQIAADAAVTRAAAAVFVWKGVHGRYPDNLAQAMSPVPADPFDQMPLSYRKESGGFVVYSVGETLHYDGGPFDKKKHFEMMFEYPPKPTQAS